MKQIKIWKKIYNLETIMHWYIKICFFFYPFIHILYAFFAQLFYLIRKNFDKNATEHCKPTASAKVSTG